MTVGDVARRAGVSGSLVHYHFTTKQRLLLAAADRLAGERSQRRLEALSAPTGMAALDALWIALREAVRRGVERAHAELTLHATVDRALAGLLEEHRAAQTAALLPRLSALLRALGARPAAGDEEIALLLTAMLDGLAAALLSGVAPSAVRAAYDAFWLTLIAGGPTQRR